MDRGACQVIWEEARRYLLSKGLSESQLEKHLKNYQTVAPDSINDAYERLIKSMVNKQGFSNWIGDLTELKPFLMDYSPTRVLKKYPNWENLIDAIKESSFKAPSAIKKEDNRNAWVHFTKGVISGALYLSRFQNHQKFDEFVRGYTAKGRYIQLAKDISDEVHGLGFALTCDFLKELGYSDFVKPDTHIKDIFCGLGLSQQADDKIVFSSVLEFARTIEEIPYSVDKMFWLIGSGKPYLISKEARIPTDKIEFVRNTKRLLTSKGYEVKVIAPEKILEEPLADKEKTMYRQLNDILSTLRKEEKITPKEYRDYAQRWRNNHESRVELLEELSEKRQK